MKFLFLALGLAVYCEPVLSVPLLVLAAAYRQPAPAATT
jgi:hypothetical protein